MTNKIVAIQGNHPSKLNPKTDTSIFLANEIQKKKYRVFYYDPKDLFYWATTLLEISRNGLKNRDVIGKGGYNETNYLKHLEKIIDNKTTNADHMINKFSKKENLNDLYDK